MAEQSMRDYLEQRERDLEAKVARLSAALEKIAAESPPDTAYSSCQEHLKRCNEIAREALGVGPVLTLIACGSIRDDCEHDMSGWRDFKNGGTAVCVKCGEEAIEISLRNSC